MTARAERQVEAFRKRLGVETFWFAAHVALPLAVTPELAYQIWARFQLDVSGAPIRAPWIAVSDLLLSGLCHEVDEELYELDATVRNVLLTRLRAEPRFGSRRIKELAEFLLDRVRRNLNSPDVGLRDLARAQRWVALSTLQPERAAEELASELAGVRPENGPELVRLSSIIKGEAALQAVPGVVAYAEVMEQVGRGRMADAARLWSTQEVGGVVTVGSVVLNPPAPIKIAPVKTPAKQPGPKVRRGRGFGWLHLSDLKVREDPLQFERELFDDLRLMQPQTGPWDVVFLTGDLVMSGQPSQYAALDRFMDRFRRVLSDVGSQPLMIAVPGNHDGKRSPKQPEARSDWIHEFDEFDRWWRRQSDGIAARSDRGSHNGDYVAELDLHGVSLGILGLNTALLQRTGDGFIVGERRLLPFGERLEDWARRFDLTFLLTHHAPRMLTPESIRSLEGLMSGRERVTAHLFSHHQEPELPGILFEPSRILSQTGSVHRLGFNDWKVLRASGEPPRLKEFSYSAGKITFEGDHPRFEVWPRTVDPRNRRFFFNPNVTTEASLSVSLTSRRARHASPRAVASIAERPPSPPSSGPVQLADAMILVSSADSNERVTALIDALAASQVGVEQSRAPFRGFEAATKLLVFVNLDGTMGRDLEAPLKQLTAQGPKAIQRVIPLVVGGEPRRMRAELERNPFIVLSATPTPEEALRVVNAIRLDPDDPQKGRWGGSTLRNRRKLVARVRPIAENWYKVRLEVRSTAPTKSPLRGQVVFHLHPTFPNSRRTQPVEAGVGSIEFESYGSFTVGAEVDGGQTHLELDLSKLRGVSKEFREN